MLVFYYRCHLYDLIRYISETDWGASSLNPSVPLSSPYQWDTNPSVATDAYIRQFEQAYSASVYNNQGHSSAFNRFQPYQTSPGSSKYYNPSGSPRTALHSPRTLNMNNYERTQTQTYPQPTLTSDGSQSIDLFQPCQIFQIDQPYTQSPNSDSKQELDLHSIGQEDQLSPNDTKNFFLPERSTSSVYLSEADLQELPHAEPQRLRDLAIPVTTAGEEITIEATTSQQGQLWTLQPTDF